MFFAPSFTTVFHIKPKTLTKGSFNSLIITSLKGRRGWPVSGADVDDSKISNPHFELFKTSN